MYSINIKTRYVIIEIKYILISQGNIGARYHLSLDFCHYTFLESSRHLVYGMKRSLGSSGDNKSPETFVWRVPVAPYSKKGENQYPKVGT